MSSSLQRTRIAAVAVAAFAAGLFFTASMHGIRSASAEPVGTAAPSATPLASPPNSFAAVAARVTPAVVSITAEDDAQPQARSPQDRQPQLPEQFRRFFENPQNPNGAQPPQMERFFQFGTPQAQPQMRGGSGFIVSKDGYILTNNHVVDGAQHVTVGLPDRRTFDAKIVGHDPQTDVAVLKIDGTNLPTVPLGDDSTTRVGDWVLAIGNPLQLNFTVTAGIVSAKGRSNELRDLNSNRYAIQDFIQTDAAINPGNSGGPLVDLDGDVIGINSAIDSPTGTYTGYGFAIPISLARTVMSDLIAHGHVRRAILGALVGEVSQADAAVAKLDHIAGVKVEDFSPADDSPAKRAGMQPGDIISSIDGRPVNRVAELQRIIREHQPGETITLKATRYGTPETFTVKLAEAPTDGGNVAADNGDRSGSSNNGAGTTASKALGITLEALTPDVAQQRNIPSSIHGVVVTDVAMGGAAEGELASGDIITEVLYPRPRTSVGSIDDLQQVLGRLHKGDYISLQVNRPSDTQGNRANAVVNLRVGG